MKMELIYRLPLPHKVPDNGRVGSPLVQQEKKCRTKNPAWKVAFRQEVKKCRGLFIQDLDFFNNFFFFGCCFRKLFFSTLHFMKKIIDWKLEKNS